MLPFGAVSVRIGNDFLMRRTLTTDGDQLNVRILGNECTEVGPNACLEGAMGVVTQSGRVLNFPRTLSIHVSGRFSSVRLESCFGIGLVGSGKKELGRPGEAGVHLKEAADCPLNGPILAVKEALVGQVSALAPHPPRTLSLD